MIVENLESGKIISFKLKSGEEVIAKLIEFDNNILKVSKPLIIIPMQEGLGFMQYMLSTDTDEISFYKESLMNVPSLCTKALGDAYIQKTSNITIFRG